MLKQKNPGIFIILIVLLLSIVGLYLRVQMFGPRGLWGDETEEIDHLRLPISKTIEYARRVLQFPGDYLLVYPFVKIFYPNKWGIAIPHIVATIIGFYLLYLLCNSYFETFLGYAVTFLIFAYNYNLRFHAFEIRPYSVLVTLSIASFLVMKYIFEQKKISNGKRILISIFIFITVIYHLYGIYMLFFSYLFHLIGTRTERMGQALLRHLKDYWVVIVMVSPIWYYFSFAVHQAESTRDTFQWIPNPLVNIIGFLKAIFGNLAGFKKLYFLLAGLILLFIIPQKERLKQILFLFTMIFAPILLILLSVVIRKYWFVQRLFVWVMPLFAFLLGWIWDSLFAKGLALQQPNG